MTENAIDRIAEILPLYGMSLVYRHSEWFIQVSDDVFVTVQSVFELMFIQNWDRETVLREIKGIM